MINVNDYYSPRIKISPNNEYKKYMNWVFMLAICNCVTPKMENFNFDTEVLNFTTKVFESIYSVKILNTLLSLKFNIRGLFPLSP